MAYSKLLSTFSGDFEERRMVLPDPSRYLVFIGILVTL
eukprot:CAMPEP_0196999306 /NCGR_PEP_ID=MMETSP1380-20130617/4534_1 /TAXON_ID=5936 /ORGANISM="Euplotes crassus, Strain CT5" /LENGTH=37 /DNA_ID= /DNA_START= /DNA_END= /DNA_ORIENTATION=